MRSNSPPVFFLGFGSAVFPGIPAETATLNMLAVELPEATEEREEGRGFSVHEADDVIAEVGVILFAAVEDEFLFGATIFSVSATDDASGLRL